MSVTSTCGNISGFRKRLSLGPVVLMALLTAALILHHSPIVIESPYLLPSLNFFFQTLISCVVAGLAAAVYLRRGMYSALLLGSGMLIYSISSLFAGTMSVLGHANSNITLHNLSLLISTFLFLYSTIRIQQGESPTTPAPVTHRRRLLMCYGGSILLPVLLMGPILGGMLPLFFIQGQGPTMTRQLVLILAIVMLRILLYRNHTQALTDPPAFRLVVRPGIDPAADRYYRHILRVCNRGPGQLERPGFHLPERNLSADRDKVA